MCILKVQSSPFHLNLDNVTCTYLSSLLNHSLAKVMSYYLFQLSRLSVCIKSFVLLMSWHLSYVTHLVTCCSHPQMSSLRLYPSDVIYGASLENALQMCPSYPHTE